MKKRIMICIITSFIIFVMMFPLYLNKTTEYSITFTSSVNEHSKIFNDDVTLIESILPTSDKHLYIRTTRLNAIFLSFDKQVNNIIEVDVFDTQVQ